MLKTIDNELQFKAISSNGNTALINAMFLTGFVNMVRGDNSPVRLTMIIDEAARFDSGNISAFLKTMDSHHINVISAAPSEDPSLAQFFTRLCIFEPSGKIMTQRDEMSKENLHGSV